MIENLNVYPEDWEQRLQVWRSLVDVISTSAEVLDIMVDDVAVQKFWNKLFEGYPAIQELYPLIYNDEDE